MPSKRFMPKKVVCKAIYHYGNAVINVEIVEKDKAWIWEEEKESKGDFFFVRYGENLHPGHNEVGSFKDFAEALEWANKQFGKLAWEFVAEQ